MLEDKNKRQVVEAKHTTKYLLAAGNKIWGVFVVTLVTTKTAA